MIGVSWAIGGGGRDPARLSRTGSFPTTRPELRCRSEAYVYSTCIFCHSSLGANESIEHFPVGRRLAFDAARGRLWVVCRKCERWNLSPLEERWEAIEECERLFSGTRTARVDRQHRPRARRRRTRARAHRIAAASGDGGVALRRSVRTPPAQASALDRARRSRRRSASSCSDRSTGIIAGGGWGLWNVASIAEQRLSAAARARAHRSARPAGAGQHSPAAAQNRLALVADDDGWALRVAVRGDRRRVFGAALATVAFARERGESVGRPARRRRAPRRGQLLPAINSSGAKRGEVDDAVRIIGDVADPSKLFERYATVSTFRGRVRRATSSRRRTGRLVATLPKEVRLALEMATHEESERRALEGELAVLEAAWKEAEEIAAIADDLFVSDETRARLVGAQGDDERADVARRRSSLGDTVER